MIYQIVLAFTLFYCSMAEIYSSTAHIKLELSRIRQDKSIEMLKQVLDNQESSDLTHMKTLIETLDQLEADAKNPNFTVLHPLDAYRFIRNHSVIFNETVTQLVKEMQKNGYAHAEIIQLTQNLTALPEDDLIGALRGIIRIQNTYGIKTNDLAEGNVLGQYRREMTAAECKDMMIIAFYSDQIMLAFDWLEIAIQRIEAGDKTATVTALLCKAAASAFNIKRKAEAVIIYEYVVEQNPKNRYFKHKMRYYQNNTKQDVFKFVQHTDNFRNDCRKYLEESEQVYNSMLKFVCDIKTDLICITVQ
ncbi:prolyl 4-hydroxylase subunit alpha-1-like [Ruditapes philippinarum]|uniref:prolyl 4-hydroxylase subunit alpha-1-like n=1 Tax=Ruditapes philippinarum TaxID=129788 RepID=UPI00295AFA60|nr:prolyl 4-hydroxylase subunit alpha-1-like [Ruditapes philippinarum]